MHFEFLRISQLKYCDIALLQPITQYQSSKSCSVLFCSKEKKRNKIILISIVQCTRFAINIFSKRYCCTTTRMQNDSEERTTITNEQEEKNQMKNYLHMPPCMMYRALFPTIYIQLRTIVDEK